ncbi:MAG TPA: glycosyltransferase family 4 protein [Solirubrobacteraceae bacterium]|nr:glycosyltransferase family 4 protein [Solirubrobacteraceae bacterium]
MSITEFCGVKDHATLLAEELRGEGITCTMHWLIRDERSARAGRAEIDAWLERLSVELRDARPDVILLHYSVFAYSHSGLPLFVARTLRRLRATGATVIVVMHEFAYPWGRGGLRGRIWAITQRLALIDVMRTAAAALFTTEDRALWVRSRRWLPGRPVLVAPVFSNLPQSSRRDVQRGLLGLFGYSYDPAAVGLVLDAVRRLVDDSRELRLTLLGSPGSESPSGRAWREGAQARGLAGSLSFSGTLAPQDLSDALAACDVLLFVASAGPSSRKGTLAGSLASGRPVVATDGPNRWIELVESDAALVVEPTADALADAIGGLLLDETGREALGARSREFYLRRMSVARTAGAVMELIARTSVRNAL